MDDKKFLLIIIIVLLFLAIPKQTISGPRFWFLDFPPDGCQTGCCDSSSGGSYVSTIDGGLNQSFSTESLKIPGGSIQFRVNYNSGLIRDYKYFGLNGIITHNIEDYNIYFTDYDW